MKSMLSSVDGHKTYVLAALAILAVLGYAGDMYSREALEMILTILGFGSIAALRHGIEKK